jgi:hypothetical protein
MNQMNGKKLDKKKIISKGSKSSKSGMNKMDKNPSHQDPIITNWYIMFEDIVPAKLIAQHLEELGYGEIDLWSDINILALELEPKVSMDFEPMEPFEDPSDVTFINDNKIQTIYALTLSNGLTKAEKKVVHDILDKWNGLLCGDSEDFTPIYRVKNL